MAPPAPTPPQMSPGPLRLPHGHGAHQGASGGQQTDDRFHNLIRPANIENLKEHLGPGPAVSRPSIMHHVGKPPDLNIKYPEHQAMPPVSLPYRDAMHQSLHLLSPPLKGRRHIFALDQNRIFEFINFKIYTFPSKGFIHLTGLQYEPRV